MIGLECLTASKKMSECAGELSSECEKGKFRLPIISFLVVISLKQGLESSRLKSKAECRIRLLFSRNRLGKSAKPNAFAVYSTADFQLNTSCLFIKKKKNPTSRLRNFKPKITLAC